MMYELIQVADNTFYMDCPSKVGFYKTGTNEVIIIDSGNDKDAGKKVKKILDSMNWELKAIYNTHSHADHIGGNKYLTELTGCKVYANGIDRSFTKYPVLEPSFLYGGYPLKELKNKFLMAGESDPEPITENTLPIGLNMTELPGHSYDMIGFKTSDNVYFIADSLSGTETLQKYQINYLYDVEAYIDTLEKLKSEKCLCFIPSHAPVTDDISALAQLNIDNTLKIADRIKDILTEPMTFEELLSVIFESYNITMNLQQRMLIGCTVKSYLSYLNNQKQINFYFSENKMIWNRS